MTPRPDVDLILVGGGLASGLIALAAKARRPEVRIALIERASTLGGNHTWCWHAGDTHACTWVEPLVVQRWDGYAVRFPTRQRELDEAYAVTTSARLDQVVRAALTGPGDLVRTGHVAASVATDHVVLDDGSTLTAPVVVDARGPDRLPPARAAYQKFVGLEVELAAPVGPSRPILMDAQVPQRGAFRFVYTLPFAPDRLLIEDTYYADTPELDHADIRAEVLAYAAAAGWPVQRVVREEAGVLPLPLDAVVTAHGYAGQSLTMDVLDGATLAGSQTFTVAPDVPGSAPLVPAAVTTTFLPARSARGAGYGGIIGRESRTRSSQSATTIAVSRQKA